MSTATNNKKFENPSKKLIIPFFILIAITIIGGAIWEQAQEEKRQQIFSDIDIKVNSFYSSVDSQRYRYIKDINKFFDQKRQSTAEFAEFIVENSGDMPNDEYEQAKWIKHHFERFFFSNIDIANLLERNSQEYIATSINAANKLALSIEKEYNFDVNKDSTLNITGVTEQHQDMLNYVAQLTDEEYYNSWLAEGGSFAAATATMAAVKASGGVIIGKAIVAKSIFLGPIGFLGGLGLGALVNWFISDSLEEERKKEIAIELNNMLNKTQNMIKDSTAVRLAKIDKKRSDKWRNDLKIILLDHKKLS